jgi:putative serine protease PepD
MTHPRRTTTRQTEATNMDRTGKHRSRTTLAAAGIAAAALFLTACESSEPGATGSTEGSSPVGAGAQSIEDQFVQVVKDIGPSVVLIQTKQGLGSGIIFDRSGDIVTNNHVLAGGGAFQVTLASGKQYNASFMGSFAPDDLAVLRVDTAPGMQAATLADSSKLSVGDLVMAVGNPLGLQSSVTEGIVSALGRTVSEGNGVTLPGVIQTSAEINPGNSGGALVNLNGEVVGIPTLTATDPQLGGAAPGIGFAIPSNTVKNIATQLVNEGTVTNTDRAYLGVQVGATTSGGVLVTKVEAGGPAATAGITTGDVITNVDGKATPDPTTLAGVVADLKPAQTVAVTVTLANGTTQTVQVTLGQYPG